MNHAYRHSQCLEGDAAAATAWATPFTSCLISQDTQQRLDEEVRSRTKMAKRQERADHARRNEVAMGQQELNRIRENATEAEQRAREAMQKRDVQLAVAETQAVALRGQIEQLEAEVRRLGEQMAGREKEISTAYEERLHLELKQQQLRYDRRMQVRQLPFAALVAAAQLTQD